MMIRLLCSLVLGAFCSTALASGQTADDIIAKNIAAKGGLENIKAVTSRRMTGRVQSGGLTAQVSEEAKAARKLRQEYIIQGLARVRAYDGEQAWQIAPFEGRRDPELMGESGDQRNLIADADFYGPLVDYAAKGHTVEYLGDATVDGDLALHLRVTLANGDIVDYYLDPDVYLEIREERRHIIDGAASGQVRTYGSYKRVHGVYMPFSIEITTIATPNARTVVTVESIEANVEIPDSRFRFPADSSAPRREP